MEGALGASLLSAGQVIEGPEGRVVDSVTGCPMEWFIQHLSQSTGDSSKMAVIGDRVGLRLGSDSRFRDRGLLHNSLLGYIVAILADKGFLVVTENSDVLAAGTGKDVFGPISDLSAEDTTNVLLHLALIEIGGGWERPAVTGWLWEAFEGPDCLIESALKSPSAEVLEWFVSIGGMELMAQVAAGLGD